MSEYWSEFRVETQLWQFRPTEYLIAAACFNCKFFSRYENVNRSADIVITCSDFAERYHDQTQRSYLVFPSLRRYSCYSKLKANLKRFCWGYSLTFFRHCSPRPSVRCRFGSFWSFLFFFVKCWVPVLPTWGPARGPWVAGFPKRREKKEKEAKFLGSALRAVL